MTRVLFMGTPDFAVPSLRALCEGGIACEVVGVVTREDKPAGRGRKLTSPPTKTYAAARGIPVLQPKGVKKEQVQQQLRDLAPDLIVVAAYGRILPPAVLGIPTIDCVNVHASLLPRHRGASPIAHAILAGDREAGVCIMRMEEGLDTGPVYHRAAIPMPQGATAGGLTELLANVGADALHAAWPGIVDRTLVPEPQDESCATFAPLLHKQDGHLDFSGPAVELERRVRAFHPWPGAHANKGDLRFVVSRASVAHGVRGEPGAVVEAGPGGILVACGEDGLRLEEVKPAGKKTMPAAAWVSGRGAVVGDLFS
jgi:methionyl-tRNA formyltransferase